MKLEAAREEERKVGAKSTHKYLMPAQAGGKSAKPQWTPSLPSKKWSTQLEQKRASICHLPRCNYSLRPGMDWCHTIRHVQ